ncbi:hypothetical protein C365_03733 [Cryptococcus neoformans Bt85]|nr:hypothetical protein C365_03733 [Cryptococcus neoformans var. grubii Bt85]OXM79061.1 hypothetical protein C364_03539 [Cryptococcus neoformans var. grubii Bt63]
MGELMKAYRGRYRELPQWKHLYVRAIAKVPGLEQLNLLKPMMASDTYRRPAPLSAFSSGCRFCVTNPNDLTESVELKRDTSDGTMLTRFRKLTKTARDETKREFPSLVTEDPDHVSLQSDSQYGKTIIKERLEPLLTGDFPIETEKDMFANILVEHEAALAWAEEEKGCFDARYIPPYKIPFFSHVPWQDKMIRMTAKSKEDVIAFLKEKKKWLV